jgi:transposase
VYCVVFIRKNTRQYKGRTYVNYLLVESIRTEKGPRQRTVCSLGDLKPRPAEEWLQLADRIEDALVGQKRLLDHDDPEVQRIVRKVKSRQDDRGIEQRSQGEQAEDLIAVHVDRVSTEEHREAGPVFVGHQFWQRLGLDDILTSAGLSERTRLLTCAMTMNRLIAPRSEHAMPDWIRRTALGDILEVDFSELSEASLYRNLDTLHPERAVIESGLVERERNLFNLDNTIFLYDLTSTYFEGEAKLNRKAKRGYSRDKRPDCKQVVIGLVVNRDGFPVAHEVLEGNVQDRNTLGDILALLEKRVGLEAGQTVVVDRGMAFDDNLAQIRARNLHYIVASRQPERNQWLADFEDTDGFEEVIRQPSPLNPAQKKPEVKVKMRKHGDEHHVLCTSSGRVEKDRAIREKHERRLLLDLDKLRKRIADRRLVDAAKVAEAIGRLKERYPRVARYYRMSHDKTRGEFSYRRDEEKYSKAKQLDGSYLLKTDRDDLSADDVWRIYNLLTRAENAFREMKSPLAERPIFHHLEHRVETHIFLCVLAYHLLVAIEKTLLDQGVHTSWATIRDTLSTHQVSTIVLPTDTGAILRVRKASTPEPHHQELYRLLSVSQQVMSPKKTWTKPNSAAVRSD